MGLKKKKNEIRLILKVMANVYYQLNFAWYTFGTKGASDEDVPSEESFKSN